MAQLDPGRAATDLARATELDRNQPDYWNNLGFALLASGDPEAAVSALRQAQDLDSESRTIRNNLGLAYIAQGKVADASALLDVTYPPAEARYRLAVALELYGAKDEARRSYAEALSLDPALSAAMRALDRLDGAPGSTEERATPGSSAPSSRLAQTPPRSRGPPSSTSPPTGCSTPARPRRRWRRSTRRTARPSRST